jgi:hypothetical protein
MAQVQESPATITDNNSDTSSTSSIASTTGGTNSTATTSTTTTTTATTGSTDNITSLSYNDGSTGTLLDVPPEDIPLVCGLSLDESYEQYTIMTPPACIVMGNTNYTAFYPTVDDFSLMQVEGSFGEWWLDDAVEDTFVRVEVGGKTSHWRRRGMGLGNNKKIVPFWTVIVELDQGQVRKLQWDDGCYGCDESSCIDSHACGEHYLACTSEKDCDLKIFMGWYGTDVSGNYLTSASKRLSRFRDYALKEAFDSTVKRVRAVKEGIRDAVGANDP